MLPNSGDEVGQHPGLYGHRQLSKGFSFAPEGGGLAKISPLFSPGSNSAAFFRMQPSWFDH